MEDRESSAADQTDRPDAEHVRAQMARILGDPSFVGAPQLSRLLQRLVENALTGDVRDVKEYSLGVELFERGASFDPKIDTVVRAAARRLRQRLEAYFEGPGKADPVVVAIPKGHYLAVFRANDAVRASNENGTRDEAVSPSKLGPKVIAMAIVAALVLIGTGVWWFWNRAEPAVATTPSILVLPFQNLSDSSDTNYFAAGVHEDLLTLLARIKGLNVISHRTSEVLAASNKSVKEMAATAGVDHVLEGSIRRTDDRVRLTVQLVAAADQRHVWAETYDRKIEDIFAIQDELARSIAERLRIRLDRKVVEGFAKARTMSIEAYELVLRNRSPQMANVDLMAVRRANLEHAIELDPNYADAYADLAGEGLWGWVAYDDDVRSDVMKNAEKALSIDPENAHALVRMATVLERDGRSDLAQAYLVRALSAAPGDSEVQWFYALHTADYRERWRHVEESHRLDPLYPDVGYTQMLLAQGRAEEALEVAKRHTAFAPQSLDAVRCLEIVYRARGDSVAALRQLRRGVDLFAGFAGEYVSNLSTMGQSEAAWRWHGAIKHDHSLTAWLLLHAGEPDALGNLLGQWLAEAPRDPAALGFYATLQARRADAAFDRRDAVARQAHLADAMAAFRDVPFPDDRRGFDVSYLNTLLLRLLVDGRATSRRRGTRDETGIAY